MDWTVVVQFLVIPLVALVYHDLKANQKRISDEMKEKFDGLEKDLEKDFARQGKQLDSISQEIGSHTAGLRGRSHRNWNAILSQRAALIVLGEKTGVDLKPWLLRDKLVEPPEED